MREEHQSYPGRLHGGISSTILDETIGRAILLLQPDVWGVTVEIKRALPQAAAAGRGGALRGAHHPRHEPPVRGHGRDPARRRHASPSRPSGKYLKQTLADITDGDFAEREWFADPREAPGAVEL